MNILLSLFGVLIAILVPVGILSVQADGPVLRSGNIVDGKNVTNSDASYIDPVSASLDQKVRLRLLVMNEGQASASNVQVKFNLGSGTAPTATITSDNAGSQTDFVNINPGGTNLQLVSGSGKKYGPPDCLAGCSVGDEVAGAGITLGTVEPGAEKSYQVTVEADVKGQSATNRPVFRGGNIFDGGNRTSGTVDWQDPIPAQAGEVIEFRVVIANIGDAPAGNVNVRAELQQDPPANSLISRVFISGGGAETVTDTATIRVSGGSQVLSYIPGHTRQFGPGCEQGCNIADGVAFHGIDVGTVQPGENNSFQVAFKAYVSNRQPPPSQQSVCDNLNVSPISGNLPLGINANLSGHTSGGGSISSYRFNFGDGTGDFVQSSTSLNHTFNSLGTFTVRGYVKDNLGNENGGSGSCQATVTVNTVSSQRAVCDGLSVSQNSGTAPVYVNSVLSGHTENGGSIVSYKFNFGDGTGDFSQSGNALGHTFNSVGTYVISGIVTDNLGNQAGGSVCQKVITTGQVLGTATPPSAIPKTGPETAGLFTLFGSGTLGWILRKFRIRI